MICFRKTLNDSTVSQVVFVIPEVAQSQRNILKKLNKKEREKENNNAKLL